MDEKESLVSGKKTALPKDTFYVGDLVGLRAVDETGAFVGTVMNVLMTKQQCLEIAVGKTAEELAELERVRREALAETEAHMREFDRKLKENPGAVPNAAKARKAERRKFDRSPKIRTFLVPFVGAYVGDVEPENGVLHLKNVNGLMEI